MIANNIGVRLADVITAANWKETKKQPVEAEVVFTHTFDDILLYEATTATLYKNNVLKLVNESGNITYVEVAANETSFEGVYDALTTAIESEFYVEPLEIEGKLYKVVPKIHLGEYRVINEANEVVYSNISLITRDDIVLGTMLKLWQIGKISPVTFFDYMGLNDKNIIA